VTAFDYEAVTWGGGGVIDPRAPDFLDHSLHLRWCLADLASVEGEVCEIGCGSGRFIASVQAAKPEWRCHGVDVSETAIAQAKQRGSAVQFAVGSALALPFADGQLSAALMIDVLEHLDDVPAALAEVRRVVKRHGLFHLVFPCEAHPWTLVGRLRWLRGLKAKHAGHVQALAPESLFRVLGQSGFERLETRYSYHPLGQLYDMAVFSALGVGVDMHGQRQAQVEVQRPTLVKRVRGALSRVLFEESSLLARVPLGMTVHVTARV
jgi:SAM-dependent methyltransferase